MYLNVKTVDLTTVCSCEILVFIGLLVSTGHGKELFTHKYLTNDGKFSESLLSILCHQMATFKPKKHKPMGDDEWRARMKAFAETGVWPSQLGNKPSVKQKKWHDLYEKVSICN